jgi:hypothetical protein
VLDSEQSTDLLIQGSNMSRKKRKEHNSSPNLRAGQIPRKVPEGKFIWHNQVQRGPIADAKGNDYRPRA